ncbi:MAG: flagellar motor stator protein MotA [Chthonomonadales bacterium]|nr:flagellar motor stator protein MotA [Chthonomonadales bacterium]
MFVIVGALVVLGSIVAGFTMAGGQLSVLMQISEFIVIGGAAIGALIISNPPSFLGTLMKAVLGLLKGNPYTKVAYTELLKMLYDLFMLARREGMVALEHHAEHPHESEFFQQYPVFGGNHHAVSFLTDTLKVVITGTVQPYDLAEMMDADLEKSHAEANKVPQALAKTGDAMPGFGIVAAVLGVVITMGSIGGKPEEIGHHVASALVGTFLGVLLAYGIFAPLAAAAENQLGAEAQYMACIRAALLSFARGDAPLTAVEFARRNIEPASRCSFSEMEQTLKGGAKQAA